MGILPGGGRWAGDRVTGARLMQHHHSVSISLCNTLPRAGIGGLGGWDLEAMACQGMDQSAADAGEGPIGKWTNHGSF